MLAVILIASELFTNALEYLGERLGISEGITGSLFAAIGTALPETTVPIIARLGGTPSRAMNEEIGVGAILGAPLMLATLSTFLMTCAIIKSRGLKGHVMPERTGFMGDLNFFLFAFLIACAAMFVSHHAWPVRAVFSVGLVGVYVAYVVVCTFRASASLVESGHGTEAPETLFISRLDMKTSLGSILLQFLFGIVLLVGREGLHSRRGKRVGSAGRVGAAAVAHHHSNSSSFRKLVTCQGVRQAVWPFTSSIISSRKT